MGRHQQRGAFVGERPEEGPELDAPHWVETHSRLVHYQDLRLCNECHGEREAALHAAREVADELVAGILQAEKRHELRLSCADLCVGESLERSEEL